MEFFSIKLKHSCFKIGTLLPTVQCVMCSRYLVIGQQGASNARKQKYVKLQLKKLQNSRHCIVVCKQSSATFSIQWKDSLKVKTSLLIAFLGKARKKATAATKKSRESAESTLLFGWVPCKQGITYFCKEVEVSTMYQFSCYVTWQFLRNTCIKILVYKMTGFFVYNL